VAEDVHVLVVEVDPDFDAVVGLGVLGGDEAEAVDAFGVVEVLAEEVEDEVGVDVVFVLLVLVDGEDEAAAVLVLGVLPLGLDALLEILDGVDPAVLVADEEAAWGEAYVFCLLLLLRRKFSRLLSW
jgi:hypothetical protein